MRRLAAAVAVGTLVGLTLTACGPRVDEFAEACADQGGEILKRTESTVGTGVSSSGGVVVVPSSVTFRFCLSADGRVLGVE